MIKMLEELGRNDLGYKMIDPRDSKQMWNKFVDDMVWNNTYCPEPVRVIFNIGKKAYPILDANSKRVKDEKGNVKYGEPVKVLTTVVFFDDNTKVTVTNSEHDGVEFETVKVKPDDENSPTVEVATDASKETGFVYATVKRMIGYPDKNGIIVGDGFGRKLHDIIASGYDTAKEQVLNKYNDKLAKAKYEAAKGTAKPKRPSFADTVVDLRAAVDGMKEMIDVLKADIASAKAK